MVGIFSPGQVVHHPSERHCIRDYDKLNSHTSRDTEFMDYLPWTPPFRTLHHPPCPSSQKMQQISKLQCTDKNIRPGTRPLQQTIPMLFLCLRKRNDPSRVRRPNSSSASTRDLPSNSRYCLLPTSRYRYRYQRQHPTSLCRKPPQGQSVSLFQFILSEERIVYTQSNATARYCPPHKYPSRY